MKQLKYPEDRVNGYAVLTDSQGQPYLPCWDLTRDGTSRGSDVGDAMKFCGAFLTLSKRLRNIQ